MQEFTTAFKIVDSIRNRMSNTLNIIKEGDAKIGLYDECIGLQLTDQMANVIKLGNILGDSRKEQFFVEARGIY